MWLFAPNFAERIYYRRPLPCPEGRSLASGEALAVVRLPVSSLAHGVVADALVLAFSVRPDSSVFGEKTLHGNQYLSGHQRNVNELGLARSFSKLAAAGLRS